MTAVLDINSLVPEEDTARKQVTGIHQNLDVTNSSALSYPLCRMDILFTMGLVLIVKQNMYAILATALLGQTFNSCAR